MIDIVLPYYSRSEQAWPAIQSVLAQSYQQWRLVVVDDAFPEDDSEAPEHRIEGRLAAVGDDRIEYVRNSQNIGLARNFSRCLDLVRADYFVMLGDDDYLHPDYLLSVSSQLALHPDADIVQPGVRVIDERGRAVRPLGDRIKALLRPPSGTLLKGERMAESLMRADWAYFPSLVWKTSAVRAHGFREEYAVALDYGLLLDIALADGTIFVYDSVVFDYRRHRASVSSATASSGLRFEQERKFALAFSERMSERGWHRAARTGRRRVVSRLHASFEAVSALLAGDLARARSLLACARG